LILIRIDDVVAPEKVEMYSGTIIKLENIRQAVLIITELILDVVILELTSKLSVVMVLPVIVEYNRLSV